MNDNSPAESKPPGPVPADDPERALTHVSPDTDESLPHLGLVGDTYTILVSGADTAGRYTLIESESDLAGLPDIVPDPGGGACPSFLLPPSACLPAAQPSASDRP